MSLKVGCLPYAVGKQPFIPLKIDVKLMMMMIPGQTSNEQRRNGCFKNNR